MSSPIDAWRSEPTGRKALWIILAAILVVILAASIIGWFWLTGDRSIKTGDTREGIAGTVEVTPGAADDSDEATGVTAPDTGEYVFELDENGMAYMPVTTDPAEAAAAAAAIAWSVDFEKVNRQEFFDTAIARMTRPSPDYVGPVGEVHIRWANPVFGEGERIRDYETHPEEELGRIAKTCGLRGHSERPCVWWWYANSTSYQERQMSGGSSVATPVLVMTNEEMAAWDEDSATVFPDDVDHTPDTEGATWSEWWVVSEIDGGHGARDGGPKWKEAAYFQIWCDAPKDGGICGVAGTARVNFPNVWPTL